MNHDVRGQCSCIAESPSATTALWSLLSLPSFLALASTLQPSLRSRLRLAFQPGTRNPSADGHQLQDMDGSSSSQWLAQESAYVVLNAIDIDYGNLERNQTQRMQKILGALDGFPCGIRCITLLWRWKSLNIFRHPKEPKMSQDFQQVLTRAIIFICLLSRDNGCCGMRDRLESDLNAICWRWLEFISDSFSRDVPFPHKARFQVHFFWESSESAPKVSIHFPIFLGA